VSAGTVSLEHLAVRFGNVIAVNDVSLDIEPGLIVGFIGPNGAGKTTVLDAISGLVAATGRIRIGGRDVSGASPALRSRQGLGRSFQDGRLFPGLTVRETIAVGFQRLSPALGYLPTGVGMARSRERALRATVEECATRFGVTDFLDAFLSELSTGTRRIVDIATAVAHRPSVLLLDEPSSGIAQKESEALGPLIRQVRDELDCTVLLVEHDMPLISGVSDELVAFETGQVISRGTPAEVVQDARVIEAYLGTDQRSIRRSGAAAHSKKRAARRPPRTEQEST
jgi:ABC-type branched-subunit amino acid transport system ATPase component